MIIKELTIKNFRSYYGECRFDFSDGLTLIIGDNGDGKSTFFEALKWLFDTSRENMSLGNVSEMCKSKMDTGDKEIVSVSLTFEHGGEKSVEKSFIVQRNDSGFVTSGFVFRGYETNNVERGHVDGKKLIDSCFDAFVQRYSMFQGETTLNVFDNPTALRELVDKFSDVRKFDDFVELTCELEDKSRKQYDKETRSDQKISERSKVLQQKISKHESEIKEKEKEINDKEKAISEYTDNLNELEKNQEASENYKEISGRMEAKENERNKNTAILKNVNLNTSLLDKMWILSPFPNVLKEFSKKSSYLSKEKRRQENEHIENVAKEQGRLEAQKEVLGTLINGAPGLPWYLPNQETMQEMLDDEVCKVCGRPAPKGDPAYEFMVNRLEEYKRRVEQELRKESEDKLNEQKPLFKHAFVEEIYNLSITLGGTKEQKVSNLKSEIRERLELNEKLRAKLKELEENIDKIKDEKNRLLIQAGNVTEDVLKNNFKDFKGLFELKERDSNRLVELKGELEFLRKELKEYTDEYEKLDPENSMVNVFRNVNLTLKAIAAAFKKAKNANLHQFLQDLEKQANEYMNKLSANDFHGIVRLIYTVDGNIQIKLLSSNDTEITNPSSSQDTIKYMSILFAISDFTHDKREEYYPLIFDAATSSFGEAKEQDFYNVINQLPKQCIIITKDFISNGEIREEEVKDLSCSVYRIRKGEGFNQNDLSTIRTIVNKIR